MSAIGAFLAKIWGFLSSPTGEIATTVIQMGGKKVGEKISEKVGKMFELGEKHLGDEILCDDIIAEMDPDIQERFEDFMGWLEEQQPDGKKRADKVREVIAKKVDVKHVKTGGGKKGEPIEMQDIPNYIRAQGFIKRMMSHNDHGNILQWLKKKGFFSTVIIDKISPAEKIAKREAADLKNMMDQATQWLKANKKK